MVVGKALEGFNGPGIGKILVWIQPLWYGGDESIKKQVMQQQAIETLKKELDELKKKINQ